MVIFLYLILILGTVNTSYYDGASIVGICTKVQDGDTISVRGRRIRLKHIDAPELNQLSFDKVPIGEVSRNFLVDAILGKRVEVKIFGKGYYGRALGVVYLDGVNINRSIIQEGMATHSKYSKSELYQSDEYLARIRRKGIFSTLGFYRPDVFRKKMALKKRAYK